MEAVSLEKNDSGNKDEQLNEKFSTNDTNSKNNFPAAKKFKSHNQKHKPKIDPFTVQQIIYQAEMYILLRYPHLIGINQKNLGSSNKLHPDSKFIIIKSIYEEDIHKSIKYNIWSSTKYGNGMLNDRYNTAAERNSDVFLFFACDNSRNFLGVSKLQSGLEKEKAFPLWTRENKTPGLFQLEWLFIKDVPYYACKDILVPIKEEISKPVHFMKNTQEMQFNEGKKLFEKIENYSNSNTILEHFEYYDTRQANYERMFPLISVNK